MSPRTAAALPPRIAADSPPHSETAPAGSIRTPGESAPTQPPDDGPELALLVRLLAFRLTPAKATVAGRRLLDRFDGIAALASADEAMLRLSGLSPDAAADIVLFKSLAEALVRDETCRRPVLSSWTALTAYLRVALAHLPREQFRVLYLDKRNILMRHEHHANGTIDHAPVYNSGPGRVARLGRIPDIAETRTYVATVVDCYLALTAGRRLTSSRQCASEGARR